MNNRDSTGSSMQRGSAVAERSSTTASRTHRSSAGVSWSRVDESLYVGNRRDSYLGYIDKRYGAFSAYNARSIQIGRFPTLVAAMTALAEDSHEPHPIVLRQVR